MEVKPTIVSLVVSHDLASLCSHPGLTSGLPYDHGLASVSTWDFLDEHGCHHHWTCSAFLV